MLFLDVFYGYVELHGCLSALFAELTAFPPVDFTLRIVIIRHLRVLFGGTGLDGVNPPVTLSWKMVVWAVLSTGTPIDSIEFNTCRCKWGQGAIDIYTPNNVHLLVGISTTSAVQRSGSSRTASTHTKTPPRDRAHLRIIRSPFVLVVARLTPPSISEPGLRPSLTMVNPTQNLSVDRITLRPRPQKICECGVVNS